MERTMPLSPYLAQLLEAYEPERLQALLNWLEPEHSELTTPSHLQEKEPISMNTTTVENTLSDIQAGSPAPLDDLIIFSILDEFGPQFIGKPYIKWLSRCVSEHFNTQANPS